MAAKKTTKKAAARRRAPARKASPVPEAGPSVADPSPAPAPIPEPAPAGAPAPADDEDASRGAWGSRIGFLFAAVGSAVGLGNIWRFPFVTAENGGAVFILLYLIVLLLLGIPVMWAELSLGRKGRLNPVGTMQKLSAQASPDGTPRRFWIGAGWFFVAFSVFILSWYAVITGWVMRYLVESFGGTFLADPPGFFAGVTEGPTALLYHFLVIALTVGVIAGGVASGIERVSIIVMPLLFVLILGVAVWAAFLDGSGAGYEFLLKPDFSAVTGQTFVAAIGQAFFSLSLGMGAILVYASYLSKKNNLPADGTIISFADTGVALMGGFMLFPILASFALLESTVEGGGGAGAVFLAIPAAFNEIGGGAAIAASVVFFLLLFLAAFSSTISLLEVSVSFLADKWRVPRPRAAILMGLIIYTVGIVSALNATIFTYESGTLTDIFVITGGLLIVVFVGHVMKGAAEELDLNTTGWASRLGMPLIRYLAPVILFGFLLYSVYEFGTATVGAPDAVMLGIVLALLAAAIVFVAFAAARRMRRAATAA